MHVCITKWWCSYSSSSSSSLMLRLMITISSKKNTKKIYKKYRTTHTYMCMHTHKCVNMRSRLKEKVSFCAKKSALWRVSEIVLGSSLDKKGKNCLLATSLLPVCLLTCQSIDRFGVCMRRNRHDDRKKKGKKDRLMMIGQWVSERERERANFLM